MSHKTLLKLLENYRPIDDHDRAQSDRIISFIKSEADCFKRSHLKGHVTGSAWLLNFDQTQVLLTHHKKLGKWLQLGGHADGNSDILAVALREAIEESGLLNLKPLSSEIFDVDVHLIPERKTEPAHFHYDIRFLLKAEGSEKIQTSHESNELAWVPINELEKFSQEESLLRMKKKWGIFRNSKFLP